MTIEGIFEKMAAHMVAGLMIHDQFSQMFCYLNLYGYEQIHLHQYEDESKAYKDIARYYILNYGSPLCLGEIENPDLLDQSWLRTKREDIRSSTKKQAVEECFSKWVDWERDTKALYQKLYVEALNLGEVSAAAKINEYVAEVSKELVKAKDILLRLCSIGFDLVAIYDEQTSVYDLFLSD